MGKSHMYITETIHGEAVKGGEVSGVVDNKKVNIDIKRLRQEIPSHCFEPSIIRSFSYVICDMAIFLALLVGAIWVDTKTGVWETRLLRFIIYPYLAGLPLTGLWIIGHECGHGAFSTNNLLNNTVGFLLHSFLLTPYFAWRSSHARHHQYANNMSTDLNYVPLARTEYKELYHGKIDVDHMTEDAPIVIVLRILLQQVIGWPWYLLTHITAGPESSPRKSRGWWDNSHFLPSSSLFRASEGWKIFASDVGLICMGSLLYTMVKTHGLYTVLWTYILPWMWVNHWIVMVTYLHHTSPSLPKYTAESWTYLRGALATVDRDPGFVLKYMFHHIIDLHVVHHIFPRVPHYHAQEATDAIKPLLGPLYHADSRSYFGALWDAFTQCQWVEPDSTKIIQTGCENITGDSGVIGHIAGDPSDEEGILWYRPGPMPRVATIMRTSN